MGRVIIALIVGLIVGYLGLKLNIWLLHGTVNVMSDVIGLLLAILAFWLVYRFLADKVEDHEAVKNQQKAVDDAYQRGLEDGRRQAEGAR
nr:hypothetical protein [uncultured Sphingomonas sp.]